jgi:hypothetical protein
MQAPFVTDPLAAPGAGDRSWRNDRRCASNAARIAYVLFEPGREELADTEMAERGGRSRRVQRRAIMREHRDWQRAGTSARGSGVRRSESRSGVSSPRSAGADCGKSELASTKPRPGPTVARLNARARRSESPWPDSGNFRQLELGTPCQ